MTVIPIRPGIALGAPAGPAEPRTTVPKPKPGPRPPAKKAASTPRDRASGPLERLDPKSQVSLHPTGCRCSFHAFARPWGIPRGVGKAVPLMQKPRVVLYDVENQQGSPSASALDVAQAFRFTRGVLSLTREDYVIFGMSHFTAERCSFALPTTQAALVVKSGPSGADLALLDAVDLERLSKHYSGLVVVSNDYIFAKLAKEAKEYGMTTWNVSSDLSRISDQTRAAYDGWTHLKLSVIRKNQRAKAKAKRQAHALATVSAPAVGH